VVPGGEIHLQEVANETQTAGGDRLHDNEGCSAEGGAP